MKNTVTYTTERIIKSASNDGFYAEVFDPSEQVEGEMPHTSIEVYSGTDQFVHDVTSLACTLIEEELLVGKINQIKLTIKIEVQ